MKPVLAVLGIGTIVLGFFGITHIAWIGWLLIVVGVLALVASASRQPGANEYGGLALGVGTLILWIVALAFSAPSWLVWLTFLFGVAYVLSSPVVSRGALPPGRGPGSSLPPR